MTTKQMLLSALILGFMNNVGLAMENNPAQQQAKRFDKQWGTMLSNDCTFYHSIMGGSEFAPNWPLTNCKKNENIKIIEFNKKTSAKKTTVKSIKEYTNQGTIERYKSERHLLRDGRDYPNWQKRLSDHMYTNNAVFCPKEQVIIYNTTDTNECADYAAAYQTMLQKEQAMTQKYSSQ